MNVSTPFRTSADAIASILDGTPEPLIVKDRSLRFLFLNAAACALIGRPREALTGRSDRDLWPEDVAERLAAMDKAVLATGEGREHEERLTTSDRICRTLRLKKRRITVAGPEGADQPLLVETIVDVSEFRRREEDLRASAERYRAIADQAPVMIWVADETGDTSFFSRLWLETTGQKEEEALGFGWVDVIHPDDREVVKKAFFHANTTRKPVRAEYRLRRADGSWAWILDVGRPRFAADGSFLGYIGCALDISERRAAETARRETQAFIKSIFDSSVDCVRVLDLDGRPLMMNKAGRDLFGISSDAGVQSHTWSSIGNPADAPRVEAALQAVRQGRSARFEITVRDVHEKERCMDVVVAPIPNAEGVPYRTLSIWRDISDAKHASEEAELARRQAETAADRLSAVLDSTMDSVMFIDRDWHVRYLNENARHLLRLDEKALGAALWRLFPRERKGLLARSCRRVMQEHRPASFEDYLPSLDIWLEVNASPTQDGISIFFRDITERRRAEEDRLLAQKQIAHMARHDMLTGLPNRLFFRECFDQALEKALGSAKIAVLCLDLDGFKLVNDTFGHPAGDALLRQVSTRLGRVVAETDTAARLGGDEFAVIRRLATDGEAPSILAQRIIDALSEPYTIDTASLVVGASVGIAVAPDDGTTADELIKAADVALYSAKAAGRGTYRQFEPEMGAQLQAHQQMKLALRRALDRRELELYYQPLVSLRSKKVSGCEALVRWRNAERGMVAPENFIPIAEETGLIVPIGEWVLKEACREAAAWPASVSIAVNLSPIQFRDKKLVKAVAAAIAASGIDPARLQLEITESVLLDESDHNLELLQELRNLGVKIAMDDFGTGYSSLGYLRSFPFDKIKVDRAFIRDLPSGKESLAILKAVAGLGHSLGITTTVEGVETEGQLETVNAEGFDEAQGYLFAQPLPASEITLLIAAGLI